MAMKIYEIPVALRMVFDEAFVDEETSELIFDSQTFAEVCESAEAKIANCGRYIREQEHEIEAMKKASKDILERAEAKQKKLEWLKRATIASIHALGKPVEDVDIRVNVAKCPEKIDIAEGTKLPDRFIRVTTKSEADKKALKEALDKGEEIEGVKLVTNYRLSIK